jgi:DNA-binding MarR family transcriptional regulator
MSKTSPRLLPGKAAPGSKFPRADANTVDEAFPPPTISLDAFESDRAYRKFIFGLISLQNQMQRHADQFARYIGTNPAQFHMIMIMAGTPDLTVSQVAQLMNVTSQFVTIEVGKLIRKGIVEKRPNERDRRSSFLNLTPKGKDLVRELAPVLRRANDLHFRSLTEERAGILTEMLHAIIEDGRRVIHELESPDIRNAMAPSARSDAEIGDTPRAARKEVRRR